MSETFQGACLCGGVAFEVRDPEGMGYCHCTRCQRWTGGAGLPELEMPAASFTITSGQELLRNYPEEGHSVLWFCGTCGSSLYAEWEGKIYVGAGTVGGATLTPDYHMMVAYKAPWDEITGTAPQYPEWPPAT